MNDILSKIQKGTFRRHITPYLGNDPKPESFRRRVSSSTALNSVCLSLLADLPLVRSSLTSSEYDGHVGEAVPGHGRSRQVSAGTCSAGRGGRCRKTQEERPRQTQKQLLAFRGIGELCTCSRRTCSLHTCAPCSSSEPGDRPASGRLPQTLRAPQQAPLPGGSRQSRFWVHR